MVSGSSEVSKEQKLKFLVFMKISLLRVHSMFIHHSLAWEGGQVMRSVLLFQNILREGVRGTGKSPPPRSGVRQGEGIGTARFGVS